MAMVEVIERLLEGGKTCSGMFASLLEASVRLKEMQEEEDEVEEDDDDDKEVESDGDNDDETEDDEEDSDVDEHEETGEEFLNRYEKAATALQDGPIIEDGDVEDQHHVIELGCLEDIDLQSLVQSLLQRFHHVLLQGQRVDPQLFSSFLDAFPKFNLFFQRSMSN